MRMKRLFLVCMVICGLSSGHTLWSQQLPDDVEISLLTAAPGEELYAAFGHSAIRVKAPASGIDIVFNYGVFDFNAPNFYLNFARGRMNYRLAEEPYRYFAAMYAGENRGIKEQVFSLDSKQKQFLVQFLAHNNLPENRHYLYHFFLDNCATRIRDLMLRTYDGLVLPAAGEELTYRELVHRYLKDHPWGRFGIDIALGLPTDKKTGMSEQMFLPDCMFNAFAQAAYQGRPIIEKMQDIFVPGQPATVPAGPVTPMAVCCALLALSLLFRFIKKGAKIFDFILFMITGFTGLVVFLLWFFTDHTNTHGNLNIIWALPTHLIMAFFLLPQTLKPFVKTYFLVTAVIALLLLTVWAFLPQKLNPALIPLTMAIAVRAYGIANQNFHLRLKKCANINHKRAGYLRKLLT